MNKRNQFDLLSSALAPGRTLIEASAGTGKTYTIAGIVLRLVLEEGLGVDEILVTTYTELATAELRNRIRRLLRETLDGLEKGSGPNEGFVSLLLKRHQSNAQAGPRLRLALQGFDEAPIYTIHGFCQRMLKDHAFESGALFDAELITDQTHILREIVDDFWRTHFYATDPILSAFAIRNGLSREKLLKDIEELVNKPTLLVIPAAEQEIAHLQHELVVISEKMRLCWTQRAAEVQGVFAKPPWAKRPYNDPAQTADLLAGLNDCLSEAIATAEQLKCIAMFASGRLAERTRVGVHPPQHDLFEHCERLLAAGRKLVIRLEAGFFAYARAEMKRRKAQKNLLSFDDMLTRFNDSLDREGGAALARRIRDRFKAALIDEFQDTDPIQYSIFEKIYTGGNNRVFFIGDPKQAIYSFRGADVFAYLEAAKVTPNQFTLGYNWRSETNLVRAINALFELPQNAFVIEGISFQPVEAAGQADENALTIAGGKEPPLQVWLAISERPITKTQANRFLPKAVASEIARLLNNDVKLGSEKVHPRNIAILVATNAEARMVQEALIEARIPSVLYSAADVFKSHEALELERILAAVIEPAHEKLVRAALTTDALGLTGEALEALTLNDRAAEARLLRFQRYHQRWREKGFIQMLRMLFLEQGARARLLAYPDGERRLTNMLHLAELLHRFCNESRLGMNGLLKRLGEQIRNRNTAYPEEYELRLERDEKAVRVVTVHRSKGLEYDIAFCPYSWSSSEFKRNDDLIFHDKGRLVLDLEENETHRQTQAQERLAEDVRLLYVALTRAKHRCYFVWGNFRSGELSAPAHVLGAWPSGGVEALAREKTIAMSKLPEGTSESYRGPNEPRTPLEPRSFARTINRSYGIASFSRLISGYEKEPESPEEEEIEPAEAETPGPESMPALSGMFAFPRGTGPGICLHHIFEELDFSQPGDAREIVRQRLRAFNIHEFDEVVCEMIDKVLGVSLRVEEPEFTFSRVRKEARLSEVEFYFPIGTVKRDRLAQLLGDNRLPFQPMSGFMKGYIDLIFEHEGRLYIADWKSNWLGGEMDDYAPAAMEAEMTQRFYNLQLSIYTVALHRFLLARKPGYSYEKHFGGVFYLFLRGIEPARPELGVHRARPDAGFIEQLNEILNDRN